MPAVILVNMFIFCESDSKYKVTHFLSEINYHFSLKNLHAPLQINFTHVNVSEFPEDKFEA